MQRMRRFFGERKDKARPARAILAALIVALGVQIASPFIPTASATVTHACLSCILSHYNSNESVTLPEAVRVCGGLPGCAVASNECIDCLAFQAAGQQLGDALASCSPTPCASPVGSPPSDPPPPGFPLACYNCLVAGMAVDNPIVPDVIYNCRAQCAAVSDTCMGNIGTSLVGARGTGRTVAEAININSTNCLPAQPPTTTFSDCVNQAIANVTVDLTEWGIAFINTSCQTQCEGDPNCEFDITPPDLPELPPPPTQFQQCMRECEQVFCPFAGISGVQCSSHCSGEVCVRYTEGWEGIDSADTCLAEGIGFLLCPIANSLGGAADWLYDMVEDMLINRIEILTDQGVNSAYSQFRNWANILLGIIFLIMIISSMFSGTATGEGSGMFSNYNFKKTLPKLIMFAIFVNISFYISAALFDISNIVGNGISGLFTGITSDIQWGPDGTSLGGGGQFFGWLIAGASIGVFVGAAFLVPGFISSLLMIVVLAVLAFVLSIFVALVALVIRQAALTLFVIISPIAFALAILPNTEQYFKKWWGLFLKMLFFFPFVALVFHGSRFVGGILANIDVGEGIGFMWMLMTVVLTAAPLFFLPKLFTGALAGMGVLGGMVMGKMAGMASGISGSANKKYQESDMRKRGVEARKNLKTQRKAAWASGEGVRGKVGGYIGAARGGRQAYVGAKASQDDANIKAAADQTRARWIREELSQDDIKELLVSGGAVDQQAARDSLDGMMTEEELFKSMGRREAFTNRATREWLASQSIKKGYLTGADTNAYTESKGENDFVKAMKNAGEAKSEDDSKKFIARAESQAAANIAVADTFDANVAKSLTVRQVAALNTADSEVKFTRNATDAKGNSITIDARTNVRDVLTDNRDNDEFIAATTQTLEGMEKFAGGGHNEVPGQTTMDGF